MKKLSILKLDKKNIARKLYYDFVEVVSVVLIMFAIYIEDSGLKIFKFDLWILIFAIGIGTLTTILTERIEYSIISKIIIALEQASFNKEEK